MTAATSAQQPSAQPAKGLNIALWVLQIGLAAMFLLAGGSKIGGAAAMIKLFEDIGIGQWFRYFTGILELLSGVLLLVPSAAGFGALLLLPIMTGATLTHLLVEHNSPAKPLVLLLLAAFVAWGRREAILGLLRGTQR
jgi:uncharacterized membrane protein YphA (DoxX/SURF4 family)